MARIEETVEINRPISQVFGYTTQAANWPKWQTFITGAEQVSSGAVGVGTTFKGTNRLMGLSMKWSAQVTQYQPNGRWGKDIRCGSIVIGEQLTFVNLGAGTRFTIVYEMKVGGLLKVFSPAVISTMRKETKKSLINLKGIIEAQD